MSMLSSPQFQPPNAYYIVCLDHRHKITYIYLEREKERDICAMEFYSFYVYVSYRM